MSEGKKVVALKVYVYAEKVRERGEIFEMVGGPHDYSMLKFRHVREWESSDEEIECDACSVTFAHRMGYEQHIIGRIHPQSPNFEKDGRTNPERAAPTLVTPLAGISRPDQARIPAKDVPIYS